MGACLTISPLGLNSLKSMGQSPLSRLPIPKPVLRLLFTGQLAEKPCSHRHLIKPFSPAAKACPQCVALGDQWPDLRMCMVCGHIGCCDTSKNKHALMHFRETGHPLVKPIRPERNWIWCYVDQALL